MPQLDIVVIGASAGGLQPLQTIAAGLPVGLPVAVLVVVHTRTQGESYLPQILARHTELPVMFAEHDAPARPGHIYIAPPDMHLRVSNDGMKLSRGPKEGGFRPAIDPLFRSAARFYGARAMGVILSGSLDDGTYGMRVLKEAGAACVVQDPNEAAQPSMPLSAIRYAGVEEVLPAQGIAELITRLAGKPVEGARGMARKNPSTQKEPEHQAPSDETDIQETEQNLGPPSGLTCPDCGGALWEQHNGQLMRYRCHVGHQFSAEALDAGQQEAVEGALWSAVRVLEEHAELRERMARRTEASGMAAVSQGFADSARDSQQQAHTIRELLYRRHEPPLQTPVSDQKTKGRRETKARRRRR